MIKTVKSDNNANSILENVRNAKASINVQNKLGTLSKAY